MRLGARVRSLAVAAACAVGVLAGVTAPAWAATPYTVRQGDTYWSLSHRFGVSIAALETANPTHPWWNLYPGLHLVIPGGSGSTPGTKPASHTGNASGGAAGSTAASGPVGGISQASLDLIAQMAVAEEGNRSYQDQLGVAAVIINRLKNGGFGSTVHAVLFAPYQFTPVSNGYFYKVSPTATSLKAAAAAAAGQDPTGGALYFYDPGQGVSSSWIYTRAVTTIIDGTVYAR